MIRNLIIWKMYWNRAMSHLGVPLGVFEKIALLVLLLKMFNVFSIVAVVIATIGFIGCTMLLGWVDVHYKIYETEMSINNQYNKELMSAVRRARRKTK